VLAHHLVGGLHGGLAERKIQFIGHLLVLGWVIAPVGNERLGKVAATAERPKVKLMQVFGIWRDRS
jgi:hypothetical protein